MLAGTASDDSRVVAVTWRNSATGSSGSASGTSTWSATGIALVPGVNTLTVTASDVAGKTASASLRVSYSPGGVASLSGDVDSALIDRAGSNAIYLYADAVIPDDRGSGVEPMAVAPVVQDPGACTWSYRFDALPEGTYTLAFTDQAEQDDPASDDAVRLIGAATVSVPAGGGAVHGFVPSRILRVGPGTSFSRPSEAAAVARDGDVIEIDAAVRYDDDFTTWDQDRLTLRGVGGRAHLHGDVLIPNGKAIWVIKGDDVRVENIEFSGARVDDENGAGIRAEGVDLTICNAYFHDNENGILGGGGHVLIEYTEFALNGLGDGQTHNIYIDGADRFTLRHSYSHHARIGHNVKTRAPENHILYNRIMDEADGTASYAVDMPDCGVSYLIGNLIQQGPRNDNSTVVSYGAEDCGNPRRELYVINNTIVNDDSSGAFFDVVSGTTGKIVNNIFVGPGTLVNGPAGLLAAPNLAAPVSAGLVDRAGFDYRLTATSAARDAGIDPGSANGVDLTPRLEYQHPAGGRSRPVDATLDLGALEYTP